MSQRHSESLEYVWRAAITTTSTYANGNTHISYAGPYRSRNHASAAGNYELRTGASHYVLQRSKVAWEDVKTCNKNDESEE